jgi:aldehyde:ferredoxin oxidoreductase
MGLCIFGRSVTDTHRAMIADAVNNAHDTAIDAAYIERIGRETLRLEAEFNRQAGFTQDDDELPGFFLEEPLAPSGKTGRLKAREVNACMSDITARYSD